MPDADKLSMKAFWEALERRLAECGRDDLCAILRVMAQETLPSERRVFLARLARVEDTSEVTPRALQQEELLADIDDLAQEFENTAEEAEEWEEDDGWYEHDDEDSVGPYVKFVEPLTELFDRADAAFDYGHLALARAAYRELFSILDQEDDYGRGIGILSLEGVDAGETYARYLRAVYESEPLDSRPQALYTELRLVRIGFLRPRPTLNDLVQISPHPLPDQERFLADWIAFLRTQEEAEADALLREAVRLSQGTPGLEILARSEGQRRPRAYLDWCAALEEEDKPREVLLAAQEALRVLPANLSVRAEIADRLCAAAERLDEKEALRAGRWEAFRVQPTLARLLDLRDTGAERPERTALMQQVALQSVVLDGEQTIQIKQPVLAHACLLAGKFDAARQLVQDQMVLGWSSQSSAQGMVVACLMVLLSQRALDELSPNLEQVWQWGLDYSTGSWFGPGENPLKTRLQHAYAELFSHTPACDYRPESLLAWCLSVVHRRVDAIVGGQKRGAYDKAAVLTVAGAETLKLRGDPVAAQALVQEIRGRYPRHSAFQRMFKRAF